MFLGTYDSVPDSIPVVSTIQIVSARVASSQPKDELTQAVTRFCEAEKPLERKQVFSAEERRVQEHYDLTHKVITSK